MIEANMTFIACEWYHMINYVVVLHMLYKPSSEQGLQPSAQYIHENTSQRWKH